MPNSHMFACTMPAERMRGCRLATDFRDALTMARDGWTAFGTPTYAKGGGAILNGTTDYFTRPLSGELNSAEQTFHFEFHPSFASDDGATHVLVDTTGGRTLFRKYSDNSLNFYTGSTTAVLIIPLGTGGVAWTKANPTAIFIGCRNGGAFDFLPGTISSLKIGHHTSTLAEHLAYWQGNMFDWQNRLDINLMFRTGDYDPTGVQTLDSSGHDRHFTLGDGSTPTTYPTQQSGKMYFDGGDYLQRASVAQPTGAFTVAAVAAVASGGANEYIAGSGNAGVSDVSWLLLRDSSNRFTFYVGSASDFVKTAGVYGTPSINSIVCTWDGTVARIHINGVDATAATTGTPAQPSGSAQPMWLGNRPSGGATYLTGTMYDFKYRDGEAWSPTVVLDYHLNMMKTIGAAI